jgi:hypothetical protein
MLELRNEDPYILVIHTCTAAGALFFILRKGECDDEKGETQAYLGALPSCMLRPR